MRCLKRIAVAATTLLAGCLPTTEFVRKGAPILLAAGEPRTPCEKANFLELVPSHGEASSGSGSVTATAQANGLVAYTLGADEPVMVEPLLSKPGFEDALASHIRLMQPIRKAEADALPFVWAGVGGILASSGALVLGLGLSRDPTTGEVNPSLLVGGLIGSLSFACVGGILGWIAYGKAPSLGDRAELALREQMFIRPDDDPKDAVKVVNAQNEEARQRCESLPAKPPSGPAKPPPSGPAKPPPSGPWSSE